MEFDLPLGASDEYTTPQLGDVIEIDSADTEPLKERNPEQNATAFSSAFGNIRLDEGKLEFFHTVDKEALYQTAKSAPDYKANESAYNAWAQVGETFENISFFSGQRNRQRERTRYEHALTNGLFVLDENGQVREGHNYFTGAKYFFDMETVKGFLLAQRNGWNEDTHKAQYQKIVQERKAELQTQDDDIIATIGGSLSGYLASTETVTDFTSPAKIMGSTIAKGAIKSAGIEATYVTAGEVAREDARAYHSYMMDDDRTLWDSVKEIGINAGFAGAIRGLGSAVVDARTMSKIHSKIDNVTDKQIFARYAQRENYKLTLNSTKHLHVLDKAEQQLDEGKSVDVAEHLDIPIEGKYTDDIEEINIIEETLNQDGVLDDVEFKQALDSEVDNAIEEDINFFDEELINKYIDDPRMMDDDEVKLLLEDVENLNSDAFDHPRIGELLDMRENVSSKDTRYSKKLTGKGTLNQDGEYVGGTIYEPNYQADFELTKADVKAIRNGTATTEQMRKLENDLGRLDNDPQYQLDDEFAPQEEGFTMDAEGNILLSKIPESLGAGLITGVEQDEQGNYVINPQKFLAGALGIKAARAIAPDLFKTPKGGVKAGMFVGAHNDTLGAFSDIATKKTMKEIDDSQALWNFGELKDGSAKLGDLLDHEELFNEYPEMKNIIVEVNPDLKTRAQYLPDAGDFGKVIVIRDKYDIPAILHEAQHDIQFRENWPKGGSAKEFDELEKMHSAINREIEKIDDMVGYNQWFEENIDKIADIIKDNPTRADAIREEFAETLDKNTKNIYLKKIAEARKIQEENRELMGLGKKEYIFDTHEAYNRLWGEQQARATQYRKSLNKEERAKQSIEQTLKTEEGKYGKPIIRKGE